MTATALAPAWVRPTARALPTAPLLGAAVAVVGLATARLLVDGFTSAPPGLLEALLAGTVVAALHDPAADLLAASPTGRLHRHAHRLWLVLPLALALWVLPTAAGDLVDSTGWPTGPVVALTATGVALALLLPGPSGVTLGSAVTLAWGAATFVVPPEDAGLLLPWLHHPWLHCAAVAAVLGLTLPRRRR
ncbi:hypothetical protein L615_008200000070 [Nocardioides sp. J9]|uniref:hypothetical protein n=1 Tax=Nocardioides sp. J9 TaxID=935844 RepID=UPI0011A658BB|nr:hypothetical protein [Nocardioides sp. J9]TWG91184.1 hypothetical protein L615_008200000070 [Nocardioides sp. J9]